jgi:hypothetical protein
MNHCLVFFLIHFIYYIYSTVGFRPILSRKFQNIDLLT